MYLLDLVKKFLIIYLWINIKNICKNITLNSLFPTNNVIKLYINFNINLSKLLETVYHSSILIF